MALKKKIRNLFRKNKDDILDSSKPLKAQEFPITSDSFLDVHYHYDKNDFIHWWGDFLNTNRELWNKALSERSGKRILFATSGGGFSHRPLITVDYLLSMALTLRGAEVEFLTCDHALPACLKAEYAFIKPEVIHHSQISQTLCKGCYKDNFSLALQLGINHHLISNLVTFVEKQNAREIAQNIPVSSIKNYQIDGVTVGKHGFAGAVRYFSHSDPTEFPLGEEIIRKYFEAAIISYYAIKNLLAKNKYDSVYLTHGTYAPLGIIRETCEHLGIPVSCWNVSYLKGRFSFVHGDVLPSILNEPNHLWENYKWGDEQEKKVMDYLDSRRGTGSKDWLTIAKDKNYIPFEEFAKEKKLDLNKPIIGFLTNIIWEAVAEYDSKAFPDMLTWILKTINYFKKRKDLQLLIRIHPAEKQWHVSRQLTLDEIMKHFKELPANVFVINSNEDVNTYEAMEYCDSAIIYQTQTGLELAARGIPIIVAGDAWIRNKGIVSEPLSEEEYFKQLDQLPFNERLSEEKISRARKYAYHAFFRKMIPLSFLEGTEDWMLYRPTLKKLDELLPNSNVGLDIICEGILNQTPYIYPAEEYDS